MDRMWLGLALGGMMAFGSRQKPTTANQQEFASRAVQDSAGPTEALPRAAWLQGDPADSVYRAARAALDRRDYRQAADLFAQVPARCLLLACLLALPGGRRAAAAPGPRRTRHPA
jgi:hypothetical protein